MRRTVKRPLKERNVIEASKVQKKPENTCDSSSITTCKDHSSSGDANSPKIKVTRSRTRKNLMLEQTSADCQQKIDNCKTFPECTSLPEKKQSSSTNEEANTSSELNSSDVILENKEKIILTVNKLFMEDLRCPPLTPFSPYNFSCTSVTSCVLLNHKESIQQLRENDEEALLLLVSEKCWYLLVAPLTCDLTENIYFSPLMFRAIFYGITVEKHEETSLRLVDILKTHLKLHPPCRKDMRAIYHEVLLGNIKIGEFTNPDTVKYNFQNIINAIEQTCQNIADVETKEVLTNKKDEDLIIPSNVEDLFLYISKKYINNDNMLSLPEFNFRKSANEQVENQIDLFGFLKKLMFIFGLTLDILEENFRMWWMKSRYKLKEKLNSKNKCPLIADVAWKKSELKGSINEHCVQIFMMFKKCPALIRQHLSRYIALLFEVARANEDNQEMKFPFFSSLCNNFADELASHIKGNDDLSSETVGLLQYVYPDWLRFKVGGILLKSDTTSGGIDDLRSIFRILLRNLSQKDRTHTTDYISGRNRRTKLKLPNLKRNVKDSEGETLVHKYCRSNNLEALRKCLQCPETNVNLADHAGWTPLHNAAAYNSVGSVKLLVTYRFPPIKGAEELNIFCLNSENESPLMCAVKEENIEIVDILLKNGAGPTIWNKNSAGFSAVDLCPNELLKNMLLDSWKQSISTFEYLYMKPIEIDLIIIMFSSYCSVYHIQDDNINNDGPTKHDIIYNFNYAQFFKDKKTLDRLFLLVKKLSRIPSNPKNLNSIALCIDPT